MKDNITYRIFTLSMALLVLVTSTGISVDQHFCRGELKSVALIGKAHSCHEVDAPKKCKHHASGNDVASEAEQQGKNKCCENKRSFVKSDQDLFNAGMEIEMTNVAVELAFHYTVESDVSFEVLSDKEYCSYSDPPPLLIRPLYILHESFLL